MFRHIDWCACMTPNYGDPGCDCPEVEELHRLMSDGLSKIEAIKIIFKSDQIKLHDEVVKRSDKGIQLP